MLLKKEMESGKLGEIYYAEASALRRRGVPTWGVFLNKEKQGGGPLIDIGPIFWVNAVATNTEPVVRCEQAAQVIKVLQAIYDSARNGGKAVTYEE